MKTKLLFLLFTLAAASGCYYDIEEELYNCSVDPAAVKYSSTVSNILTSNGCTGCHSNTAPAGGFNLSNYNGVKAAVSAGRLYGAINHEPGFIPMPQGGGKINSCDIKRIKAWIDAGAPNN